MNIYDVKFYGIYYFHDGDVLSVKLWANSEEVEMPSNGPKVQHFEITLLGEYKSKKDVLMLRLKEENTCEYMTLNYPWQIFDEGWQTLYTNVVQAEFLNLYAKLMKKEEKKRVDIYNLRFYGVYYHYKMEFSGVNIFSRKEAVHAIPSFENSFFEVTVLKEYEGQKDVLKLEFEDGTTAYETLNYPYRYMDMEDNIWKKSNDTSTPEAFMKTYLSLKK